MRKEDQAHTDKIRNEYPKYLDMLGIEYINRQGLYVRFALEHTEKSFTQICDVMDGKVLITDYCGDCYTGIRNAKRVAKAIREACPGFDIVVENYGPFEIEIYHEVEFTSIEHLHEEVKKVAKVADIGAKIGYEMLGDQFER